MSTAIQSTLREATRTNTTQLRNEGFIPSIVYGYKTENTPIAVKERDLINTLREVGRNGVIKLNVGGKDVNVVLNDYQSDVLNGTILHADFLAINMTEELEVDVTVVLVGDSAGEKSGGIVQQPNREITIKVKPSEIPESFEIDVKDLEIGDTVTVADIRDKSSFEILNDDDHALVLISAPRSEEELDEAAEQTVTEPEVIGEKEEE